MTFHYSHALNCEENRIWPKLVGPVGKDDSYNSILGLGKG